MLLDVYVVYLGPLLLAFVICSRLICVSVDLMSMRVLVTCARSEMCDGDVLEVFV